MESSLPVFCSSPSKTVHTRTELSGDTENETPSLRNFIGIHVKLLTMQGIGKFVWDLVK